MESLAPFVYERLPEDGQSIRLNNVSSKSAAQELVNCKLTHATVKDQYTALSYTWGPATQKQQILVNGKLTEVGWNLWEFLKRVSLSPDYAARTFWIDAVCINQEDDHEKSYQVAAMGRIYESASDVLIWLSPSDGSGHKSLDTTLLPIHQFESMEFALSEERARLHPSRAKARDSPALCSVYTSNRYILEAIAAHSYWDRLWIVQEFLLHKERTVVYGPFAVPWSVFAAFRKHHESTKRQRQQTLTEISSLSWLTRPITILSLMISQSQAISDYIHNKRSNFATTNGLPLPPVAKSASKPWSAHLVKLASQYAPDALMYITAWRWDTLFPTMPTMAATLQNRAENASDPHLIYKSAFFLFLQSFAEMRCFDRRDKIYGLTALLSSEDSFPIDYSINVYELYFRAVRFFTSTKDPSQEPCALLVEDLTTGLLDVLKISLSDLAKNDLKKPNYVLVPGTDNDDYITEESDLLEEESSSSTSRRDVNEYFQTYGNCIPLSIGRTQHISISCPRCDTSVVFDTSTLQKIQKLKVATGTLTDEVDEGEFVGVLQCYIPNTNPDEHIQQKLDGSSNDWLLGHLLLYTHPGSGRPNAMLDVKSQEHRERILGGLCSETLKTFLHYTRKLSESRPAIHTFPE